MSGFWRQGLPGWPYTTRLPAAWCDWLRCKYPEKKGDLNDRGATPEGGVEGRFGVEGRLVKIGRKAIGRPVGGSDQCRDRQELRHKQHKGAQRTIVADIPLVVQVFAAAFDGSGTNRMIAVVPEKLMHALERPGRQEDQDQENGRSAFAWSVFHGKCCPVGRESSNVAG